MTAGNPAGTPRLLMTLLCLVLLLWLPGAEGWVGVLVEASGTGKILRTIDAGLTWEVISENQGHFEGVMASDIANVMAVGQNTEILGTLIEDNVDSVAATYGLVNATADPMYHVFSRFPTDWYPRTTDQTSVSTLRSVTTNQPRYTSHDEADPSNLQGNGTVMVVVGGTGRVFRSSDNGVTFQRSGLVTVSHYNKIIYVDTTQWYDPLGAGGGIDGYFFVAGSVGTLLVSNDTGLHWTTRNTSINTNLYGCCVRQTLNNTAPLIIIVGADSFVASTTDIGHTMTRLTGGDLATHIDHLYDCAFSPSDALVLVGAISSILYSNNLGATFTSIDLGEKRVDRLAKVFFPGGTFGLIVGRNRVLTSRDSGSSWTAQVEVDDINYFNDGAIVLAAAAVMNPWVISRTQYSGVEVWEFSFDMYNPGTRDLNIYDFNGSTPLLTWMNEGNVTLVLEPLVDTITLHWRFDTLLLVPADYTFTINCTHDGPTGYHVLTMLLKVEQAPQPEDVNWARDNWWVIALLVVVVVSILVLWARRRYRIIDAYNRKHLRKYHVSFWRCCCCVTNVMHDDDSDFWETDEDYSTTESSEMDDFYDDSDESDDGLRRR